jgi:uroporphyrin-III C-methyltransferase
LDGLEEGAVVGTSSIRRMAELKAVRPDLRTENLRGNVRTRLSKLDNGDYDAIILAKAGLDRLGVERGMAVLDPALFTPAPAQGAIAVACRADDASTLEVLSQLDDAVTRRETDAERRIMGLLGAGCSSPVGINARLDGDIMHIDAVNFDFEEGHQRVTVDIPSDHSDEYLQKIAWRLLRKGHVYLVGSGPGDPGLMTVKSMELLRLADTVVYDALANHDVLTECKGAELIDVGKRSNNHKKTQAEINEILVEHGRKGEFVVRLKGGDPFLFGRGSEEAEALRKADVDVTVVPGVSSSISVPELAGIPVTARGISSVVTIVTGHEMDDKKNPLDWSMLAAGVGTIVILMGMERAGRIAERLISSGMSPDTRVAVVSEGSRSSQRTGVSVLSDLEGMIAREGLKAPGIIVIGDVVSQRGILGDLS